MRCNIVYGIPDGKFFREAFGIFGFSGNNFSGSPEAFQPFGISI